jgi:hypothetical protein
MGQRKFQDSLMVATVTLPIPDEIYHRLELNAQATGRSIEDILGYVLQVGSPPKVGDVPEALRVDLASLDGLSDDELRAVAAARKSEDNLDRYDDLLDRNAAGMLSATERSELEQLRQEGDRFMLRKAQAAVLLRWRGHAVISPGA